MSTLFGLIDCDFFYASCQKTFQPDLKARPVIVLSNNDGCVVARSQEAKDLGIPMGAPFFQIRADCLRQQIVVFSSNYALYGDMSRRVMQTLDFLNEKNGKSAVMVGSQLFDPSWNASRESVSPRYTTEWSDLPIAKKNANRSDLQSRLRQRLRLRLRQRLRKKDR